MNPTLLIGALVGVILAVVLVVRYYNRRARNFHVDELGVVSRRPRCVLMMQPETDYESKAHPAGQYPQTFRFNPHGLTVLGDSVNGRYESERGGEWD